MQSAENILIKAESWFPKDIKPFMLFTTVVTKINETSFITKKDDKVFHTAEKIALSSNWIDPSKSAPYFLIAAALTDQNNKVYLKEAFAIPILSTSSLMPVESNFERTILKIILKLTIGRQGLIIEKPLICFQAKNKEKYRPDFVITNVKGKNIYIEVLGSRNEEYLKHKECIRIIAIAQNYCNSYIVVKAYDLKEEYQALVENLQHALDQLNK